jgi:hypothetical protein
MKTSKQIYLNSILIIISLSIFSFHGAVFAASEESIRITAPTILSAVQIKDGENSQILISGLTPIDFNVEIYINGEYEGIANISQITDNFSRFSFLSKPLNSNKNFEVMAINQNQISLKLSAPTITSVRSIVEKEFFSAASVNQTTRPTNSSSTSAIINPPTINVSGQNICIPSPLIFGSTKNQNQTFVYIDNKLSNIIPAHEKSDGTSAFSYSPTGLERGQHSVYVVAQDNNGSRSAKSDTLSFCVSSPQIITATSTTTETIKQAPTSSLVFQKTIDKKPTNDSVNKQGGIPNLIIFIIFIACIGTWIFLVNRDLTNEVGKTNDNKNN